MGKKRRWSLISAVFAAAVALLAIVWRSASPSLPLRLDGRVYYAPQAQQALFREHTADFDALRDALAGTEPGFIASPGEGGVTWCSLERFPRSEDYYAPAVLAAVETFLTAHGGSAVVWQPEARQLEVQFYAADANRRPSRDVDGFVYFFTPPEAEALQNLQDMGGGWYWFSWPAGG